MEEKYGKRLQVGVSFWISIILITTYTLVSKIVNVRRVVLLRFVEDTSGNKPFRTVFLVIKIACKSQRNPFVL